MSIGRRGYSRFTGRSSASPAWFLCMPRPEEFCQRTRSAGIATLKGSRSHTSSCQAVAHVWTGAMSAEPFIACLVRSDCAMLSPVTARACTIFGTALRLKRCCVGIARVRRSSGACPSCRPISATHTSPILTGISLAHRNYSERLGREWRRDGEVSFENPHRLPRLAGVILHSTSHRSAKGEPSYDCVVSGYLPSAAVFCSEAIAQVTVATHAGRPERPIPRDILERLRESPCQWRAQPKSASDGDSVVLPLCGTGSPSLRRFDPAGPGHPQQEAASAAGRLLKPTR